MEASLPAPRPDRSPTKVWPWIALAVGLLCASLLLGLPARSARLYQDDFIFLYEASRITTPVDLLAFSPASRDRFPRPLTKALFWGAWNAFGLQRAPYHVMGAVLHAVVAFLLALVVALGRRGPGQHAWPACEGPCVLAALLFVAAPTHGEVLCWPAAIEKPLQAVFILACLATAMQGAAGGGRSWRGWTGAALLAALLTEEWAVVLPLALVAVERLVSGDGVKAVLLRLLPFGLLTAGVAALALAGASGHAGQAFALHASRRFELGQGVAWGSLSTLLGEDAAQHLLRLASSAPPAASVVGAVLAGMLGLAWAWRIDRWAALGLAWVPLAWLPYALFVPNSAFVSRYTYLPCLGAAAAVALLASAPRTARVRAVLVALAVAWACRSGLLLSQEVRETARARSGPQRELAEIPRTLARLGPGGTAWVFCPPLKAHFTSAAAGLVGDLPPARVRDWYDALRESHVAPGDVMLHYDEVTDDWSDLTRVLDSEDVGAPPSRASGDLADQVVAAWDAPFDAPPFSWRPRAPGSDGPARLEAEVAGIPPRGFYAVRVRIDVDSVPAPGARMALEWGSGPVAAPVSARSVEQALEPRAGRQEITLFPCVRRSFWSDGGLARLALCLHGSTPARVRRIELLAFPPRVRLAP